MWRLIPATFIFLALLFSPLVIIFWKLDKRNKKMSRVEGQAYIRSCIDTVEAAALRADRAYERGHAELVRDEDKSRMMDLLILVVRHEHASRKALRAGLIDECSDSLLEAFAYTDEIDKADMTALRNAVSEMEALCDRRKTERVAVDHGLHTLPSIVASQVELVTTLINRLRLMSDTHLNDGEHDAIKNDIVSASGEQALAQFFIGALREAVFDEGRHSSRATHAAMSAGRATDASARALIRAHGALDRAISGAHGASAFLSEARERFSELHFFVSGNVARILLTEAGEALTCADTFVATTSPYDHRQATTLTERAWMLMHLAEARTEGVVL